MRLGVQVMITMGRAALAAAVLAACSKTSPPGEQGTPASASASAAPLASIHTPPVATRPAGNLECRAKAGDHPVELFLTWDKNIAKGTLRSIAATGQPQDTEVSAELYKGEVLVSPSAKKGPPYLATIVQIPEVNQGKKSIQVGDFKQPWLPCET
jgi:hypothetical protein